MADHQLTFYTLKNIRLGGHLSVASVYNGRIGTTPVEYTPDTSQMVAAATEEALSDLLRELREREFTVGEDFSFWRVCKWTMEY